LFSTNLLYACVPVLLAFDILARIHEDLRYLPLVDCKQELRRVLSKSSNLLYGHHVDGNGIALFERACELDIDGIVAKHRLGSLHVGC
jgi:bifunctional non-homologous end joining protein LigD